MKHLSDFSQLLQGQCMFQLLAKAQEKEAQGQKVYHLEIGEPYFDAPKEVRNVACVSLHSGHTHYSNSMGTLELRESIAQSVKCEHGFKPLLEQVVVLPAHAIILFTIQCLVNEGEEVIYPDPSFPSYLSSIKLVGAKPVPIQLREENGFKMMWHDVEDAITNKTRLIILNSPSNPTGAVMDIQSICRIADLAKRHDIYLLSDETHSKIIYNGMHYSASTSDGCLFRTIILNSFSKTYAMTGFRLGYAVAPIEVAEKLGLMVQSTISCVPHFIQDAGIVALQKCEYYNRSIVAKLKIQRDWVVEELNKIGLTCNRPDGSFFVMPNISKTGMTSIQFANFMLDKGVVLIAGTDFGQYGEGYVRISYASKPENLRGAIERIKEVLK